MIRLGLATFAVAAALPAAAQTPDTGLGRVEIAGEATPACVIGAATGSAGANAVYSATGAASGEIRIVELVDPTTAQPRNATMGLVLPVVCNAAHRLSVRSVNGGLLRDGGSASNRIQPNGFGEFMGYQMDVAWAGRAGSTLTSVGDRIVLDLPDGGAGDLGLNIAVPAGGGALIAGRYADSVVVELLVAS